MRVFVCHCKQCKFVKNKRKNRKYKRLIRRWANKKMRKGHEGDVFNFYWG